MLPNKITATKIMPIYKSLEFFKNKTKGKLPIKNNVGAYTSEFCEL